MSIVSRWKAKLKVRTKTLATAQAQVKDAAAAVDRAKKVIKRHTVGKSVRRPREVIVANVVNQSARVEPVKIIVLHDTESHEQKGTADLKAIVSWFNNPKAQASAHVVVDQEGQSAQCVPDERKAWHVVAFNSRALGIEQIGFATQNSWPEPQLQQTAKYIAYWSRKYGIPITRSTTHGVCTHADLGSQGGGHHDPGSPYPVDHVLDLARAYLKKGW